MIKIIQEDDLPQIINVATTPTPTGNTVGLGDFVIDPMGDTYYIDKTGKSILTKVNKLQEIEAFRITSNGSTSNSYNHLVEVKALDVNSFELEIASASELDDSMTELQDVPKLIDGNTDTKFYTSLASGAIFKFDSPILVGSIHFWLYYGDERTYHDVNVEIFDGKSWHPYRFGSLGDVKAVPDGTVVSRDDLVVPNAKDVAIGIHIDNNHLHVDGSILAKISNIQSNDTKGSTMIDGADTWKPVPFDADITDYPDGWNWLNGGVSQNAIVYNDGADTCNAKEGHIWIGKREETGTDSGVADGGVLSPFVDIDPTKKYRYTIWAKKPSLGDLAIPNTDGTVYFGMYSKSEAGVTLEVEPIDGGTPTTNPYFFRKDLLESDKWYLIVGYVHPVGTPNTSNFDGGVYEIGNYNKVDNVTVDMRFKDETSSKIALRFYQFYTSSEGAETHFMYPRMECVDGTETSLKKLLNIPILHLANDDSADAGGMWLDGDDIKFKGSSGVIKTITSS